MLRPDPLTLPFAISSMPQQFEPEQFRAMIYASYQGERVRWWQAMQDPSYSQESGVAQTALGKSKWIRNEKYVPMYRAIVQRVHLVRNYYAEGALEDGDIVVTSMPDELPFADHDWILPMGRIDTGITSQPDARTIGQKEIIIRGNTQITQPGMVSTQQGHVGVTTVSGTGTSFRSSFVVGDIIQAVNQSYRIVSITDDATLSIEAGPSPYWPGSSYSKMTDTTIFDIIGRIDVIQGADSTIYVQGRDYNLASDQKTIQWLSSTNSPAAGAQYSIYYHYYPKCEVLRDLGTIRRTVAGTGLPQTVLAKFWRPEVFRS